MCVSNLTAKYLHVAVLIPVGEDIPLNVSERSNPGQNGRVQRHICCLQLLRGINVCGLECKSEKITAQEHGVYCMSINTSYRLRSRLGKQRILVLLLLEFVH